jgi:hypothetical protein
LCRLDEALNAPVQGRAGHSFEQSSFGQAIHDALVYTCKHLNLDLDEATCPVPRLGNGLPRCFDPFGQFIEQF